jgi:hypothetical protein
MARTSVGETVGKLVGKAVVGATVGKPVGTCSGKHSPYCMGATAARKWVAKLLPREGHAGTA